MYPLKKILVRLSQWYSLDLRALALLRIGVALVVITDLYIRAGDLSAHYTNDGFWPTRAAFFFGWKPGFWSLHAVSGHAGWILTLFILHFLAALMLLTGYRTRLATLLVWLLTISLQNRNLYILQAGDDLLRLTLLWGLFLPWNACYSLDAAQHRASTKQRPLVNFGYLVLIASVYFFTVNLKTGREWHIEHSAVYYALSLDQLRLPLGDWLYRHYAATKLLTQLVFYTELIIPFLILIPFKKGWLRFIAFLLIVLLQTGIGLTLYVGLFFIISMITALGLLPKPVMDRLEKWLRLPRLKLQQAHRQKFATLINTVCVGVLLLCLLINLSALRWFSYELRSELTYAANVLRLNQYWGMFSPNILKHDGWFLYRGADFKGHSWDLKTNTGTVDYSKPAHIVSHYKNDRWRKLAENLQNSNYTFLRPLFCKYLLTRWNAEHPEKHLAMLELNFMDEKSMTGYQTGPVTKLQYCVCNDH